MRLLVNTEELVETLRGRGVQSSRVSPQLVWDQLTCLINIWF